MHPNVFGDLVGLILGNTHLDVSKLVSLAVFYSMCDSALFFQTRLLYNEK